jgi:hypothetical protein
VEAVCHPFGPVATVVAVVGSPGEVLDVTRPPVVVVTGISAVVVVVEATAMEVGGALTAVVAVPDAPPERTPK